MARPPKGEDTKRVFTVRVRVTPAEKQILLDASGEAGCTLSDYMRLKSMNTPPRIKKATPERAAFIRGLAELGKVGSNINQIARSLNRRQLTQRGDDIPDELVRHALQNVDGLSFQLLTLLENGH